MQHHLKALSSYPQSIPSADLRVCMQAIKDALWAFATMGYEPSQAFLDQCADHCLQQLTGFNPQNVANVAWAYAKFGYAPQKLFAAMAEDVCPSRCCVHDSAHPNP